MSSPNVLGVPNKMVIVACPVTKCEVRHVAGVGVLMAIRYVDKAEQLQSGERTMLQALIDPEQALEICEALKKSVQALELGKAMKKALKKSRRKPARLLPAASSDEAPMAEIAMDEPLTADAVVAEPMMAEAVSA
jgi:hypothetical protein